MSSALDCPRILFSKCYCHILTFYLREILEQFSFLLLCPAVLRTQTEDCGAWWGGCDCAPHGGAGGRWGGNHSPLLYHTTLNEILNLSVNTRAFLKMSSFPNLTLSWLLCPSTGVPEGMVQPMEELFVTEGEAAGSLSGVWMALPGPRIEAVHALL